MVRGLRQPQLERNQLGDLELPFGRIAAKSNVTVVKDWILRSLTDGLTSTQLKELVPDPSLQDNDDTPPGHRRAFSRLSKRRANRPPERTASTIFR